MYALTKLGLGSAVTDAGVACFTCPGAVHRRIRNSRQRFGRKWLVTTTSATEAAGCVLWEEQGNVENNAAPRRSSPCATCATRARSKGSDARWEWAGKVQILVRFGTSIRLYGMDGGRRSAPRHSLLYERQRVLPL